MSTNISENLFQAIDILTARRLQTLQYDKTLLCEIIDDIKAEQGEYRVSDGSSTFTAYSDNTRYRKGTSVYVTIPQGDYSQRKIITGKYVQNGGEYYTYVAPFDNYLDITNNFIETDIGEKTLLANGPVNEIIVFEWIRGDELIPKQYTRMGLKANFKTWLSYLQPVTGSYGLRIDITSREVENVMSNEVSHKHYSYYLDSSDFYGDIYNFETYYNQESIFDISMITEIEGLRITFYQSSNFYDITKNKITIMDDGELLEDNIFLENVYLSFGFDAQQFVEDEVFLYTLDGETYDVSGASVYGEDGKTYNKNIKNLQARWVHFLGDKEAKMIDEAEDFDTNQATLHWYKYRQADGVYDGIAGDLWEEIPNTQNKFALQVDPDIMLQNEYYKIIIECPNAIWVKENAKLKIAALGSKEEYGEYDENGKLVFEQDEDGNIIIDKRGSLHFKLLELDTEIKKLQEKVDNGTDEVGDVAILSSYEQQMKMIKTSLDGYSNSVAQIWKEYNAMKKYYYSDVLTLTNETLVPDIPSSELVNGLNIIVDAGGLKGNYCIYGMTNEVMKSTDAMKSRTLEAFYKSIITKDPELNKASSICWKIPSDATMIAEPVIAVDYMYEEYYEANKETLEAQGKKYTEFDFIATTMIDGNEEIQLVDIDTGELKPYKGFYWLIRKGTEVYHDENENGEAPTSQQISTKQTYKIKRYYQQSASNNTVYCDVIKNGFTYSAHATMTFGLHGNSGTDNTLLLQMRRYKTVTDAEGNSIIIPLDLVSTVHPGSKDVLVEARLFDYNNEELQIEDVVWSMYSKGVEDNLLNGSIYVDTNKKTFYNITQKKSEVDIYGMLVETEETIKIHCIPISVAEQYTEAKLNEFMHNIVQANVFYGNCTIGANAIGGKDFTSTNAYGLPQNKPPTPQKKTVYLTTYLPIAFATTEDLIWAEIPTQIIYDASGSQPSYYKDPIKICDKTGNYVPIETCEVVNGDTVAGNRGYYPSIKEINYPPYDKEDSKVFTLKPLNMFFSDLSKQISIKCVIEGVGIWVQPLLMIQNRWPSAVLNEWDGSLTIDEKNGTILSTMLGAGKKEADNSFTGVLMGDVATGAGINQSTTGLFGYHHGAQSFGFKDDGTAFIGKAGKGRIEFFGDSGKIRSMSYSQGSETGMEIDLDDGYIHMNGASRTQNNNTSSNVSKYETSGAEVKIQVRDPYLSIKSANADKAVEIMHVGVNNYFLKSVDFSSSNRTGMKIDLNNGKIEAYDFTLKTKGSDSKSELIITSNGSPAYIKVNDANGTTLINMSANSYYLQSSNKKAKLDLGKASLTFEGSGGGKVEMEGNGSPFFKIYDGSTNIFYASNGSYYMQSSGYSSTNGGVKINFSTGTMEGGTTGKTWSINKDGHATFNSIDIKTNATIDGDVLIKGKLTVTSGYIQSGTNGAYYKFETGGGTIGGWSITTTSIKNSSGSIELNSSSGYIQAKSGSNYCKMSTDGTFFANYGTIGGWTIGTDSISNGGSILKKDGQIVLKRGTHEFSIGNGTTHPYASGLNVGKAGIVSEGGISCPNIGCEGTFTIKCTTLDATGPTLKISGSAGMMVGDRTLSDYVNDVAEATVKSKHEGGSNSSGSFTFDPGPGLKTMTLSYSFSGGVCTGFSVS